MLTLVAEVEGGYAMLVVLEKPEIEQAQAYEPVRVPMSIVPPDMGPCVSLEVAYMKPEDVASLTVLANVGAGEAIARFVRQGDPKYAEPKTKIVYRRVSSTIQ